MSRVTRHRALAAIFVVQFVLCVALVVFLCWNIHLAADYSERSQEMYVIGYRDGGVYVIRQLERARLKREIIQEANAHTAEEKL